MRAQIPRSGDAPAWLVELFQRVRRLEVNGRQVPPTGVAVYTATFSVGSADVWQPDPSGAGALIADSIGLKLGAKGFSVPPGWYFEGAAGLLLTAAELPYTGDAYEWGMGVGEDVNLGRSDVITDVAPQPLGVQFGGMADVSGSGLDVVFNEVRSFLGTTFTPHSLTFAVAGIYLPGAGWRPGGGIG